ncbi:N-acetyllactosaminide beta-1,3-N-acetylglucosaminyltransferase 4 [Aplysia californica]|uniref:Hexosyltransferase n=1 Tax=Aplysia californica TaxID=6500 RepID=A0ABM1A5F2_APLCA|nr:N-acetyllactosaminide beta-1,3-N-acetylglucosaminyltransferase 4 [Aplysia californica]
MILNIVPSMNFWQPRAFNYMRVLSLSRRKSIALTTASIVVVLLTINTLVSFKLTVERKEMPEEIALDRSVICPYIKAAQIMPELSTIINTSSPVSEFLSQPVINPHPYGYIHNQAERCQEQQPQILFVVPSATHNFERRKQVRNSRLMEFVKNESNSATLLFFLGFPEFVGRETVGVQTKINHESEKYKDIIQMEFLDVYATTLLKAVSVLKWASTYCYTATYVIRTDDDIRPNVTDVVDVVFRVGEQYDNFVLGSVRTGWGPHRRKRSKWYVSELEYPELTYPPFAPGGLLAYPLVTARLLYEATLRLKFLWVEDVFITGNIIMSPKNLTFVFALFLVTLNAVTLAQEELDVPSEEQAEAEVRQALDVLSENFLEQRRDLDIVKRGWFKKAFNKVKDVFKNPPKVPVPNLPPGILPGIFVREESLNRRDLDIQKRGWFKKTFKKIKKVYKKAQPFIPLVTAVVGKRDMTEFDQRSDPELEEVQEALVTLGSFAALAAEEEAE